MRSSLSWGMAVGVLCFIAAVMVLFCSAFIRPFGPVKAQKADRPLLEGIDIDPRTSDIVSTSCANCHSERTNWPWYSFVAPVSWIVERDVSRARKHMNFSRWSEYSIEQKRLLLGEIAGMVQARSMPPSRY